MPGRQQASFKTESPDIPGIAIVICSVALISLVKGSYAVGIFLWQSLAPSLLRRCPAAAAAFACLAIAAASGRGWRRLLPPVEGSVDIYPFELSALFAHGFLWAPRPVFQSYPAYNAELDAFICGILEGPNAPQHVFFRVQPIDGRLPALEDAGSWPVLLSRYEIVGYNGLQIHMQHKNAGRSKSVFGPGLCCEC